MDKSYKFVQGVSGMVFGVSIYICVCGHQGGCLELVFSSLIYFSDLIGPLWNFADEHSAWHAGHCKGAAGLSFLILCTRWPELMELMRKICTLSSYEYWTTSIPWLMHGRVNSKSHGRFINLQWLLAYGRPSVGLYGWSSLQWLGASRLLETWPVCICLATASSILMQSFPSAIRSLARVIFDMQKWTCICGGQATMYGPAQVAHSPSIRSHNSNWIPLEQALGKEKGPFILRLQKISSAWPTAWMLMEKNDPGCGHGHMYCSLPPKVHITDPEGLIDWAAPPGWHFCEYFK